jgi:hypothetical protein
VVHGSNHTDCCDYSVAYKANTGRSTMAEGSTVITITPPDDTLDISDYQSEKKIVDYQIQHQTEN